MELWQRRTLGILTLGGGAVGVAAALSLILTRSNPLDWLLCLAFMVVYASGIWCGIRLLEKLPGAERPTLKYWLLQIPSFGSPLLGYFLSSGFHTTVTLQASPLNLKADFILGSTFKYALMQSGSSWYIGVNVFAVAVAWWLARKIPRPASELASGE